MGIGLSIWLTTEPDLRTLLASQGWVAHEDGLALATRDYLAYSSTPAPVFPEDVPEEAASLLPGIAWHVDMSLEGVTPTGVRALNKAVTAVAKSAQGVIDDSQEGTFRLPSGVRRYSEPPRTERIDILSLGWWAYGGPLLKGRGLSDFIDTLATMLPEALPRRWGLHEPPDHSLDNGGTAGFTHFLEQNRGALVVARSNAPFVNADFRLSPHVGWHRGRFEVTHVLIEVDAQLLHQPGWGRHLSRVFTHLSDLVQPFYGEARVRRGVDRMSGHIDPESPVHPIRYNWWCGLPHGAPLASVLGPPYRDLWPSFGSRSIGSLSAENSATWDLEHTIHWSVPDELTQPMDTQWEPIHNGFTLRVPDGVARVWPFEPPADL